MRVAINGLGRIGRMVLRQYVESEPHGVDIVAANDLFPAGDLAYLLRFDSIHGRAKFQVEEAENGLKLGDRTIRLLAEKDPKQLPWKELGIDVVIESTGLFTRRAAAAAHLEAGARRVVISAPSRDADFTVILGVNEESFDPGAHVVLSNASCTTNSLVPPMKVLLDAFGVDKALVTTVHAYTATQALVDKPARKRIRGRAAGVSLIPTTTGSDVATTQVLPELNGRLRALAIRAPLPDGAITDIAAVMKREVSVEEVNNALRRAAEEGPMVGILGYSDEELVSADIIGDTRSGIVHGLSTQVVQGDMVKVQVWYDNEWGYSRRLLDVLTRLPL